MLCDNKREAHDMKLISETGDGLRVLCRRCNTQFTIRKDPRGAPEKRLYAELFKKDILQGSENLFYKYWPQFLRR